jgi:hypothetical protein
METESHDLFADQAPPRDTSSDVAEMASTLLLWSQRRYRPGVWMMFGGKRPEPERNDPFKPVGEWESLEQDLWTTQPAELEWWAGHPHPAVRHVLASHETCPADLLDRLAADEWVEVRQAAYGNNALDGSTLRRGADEEPVEWLRTALRESPLNVDGKCARCGGPVKRPDRFFTCTITCSLYQASDRIGEGTYVSRGRSYWPPEYVWEVAIRGAPGGVPGTGPKFCPVRISFVPGLSAVEADRAVTGLRQRDDLTAEQAVLAIDDLARTLSGEDVLLACLDA